MRHAAERSGGWPPGTCCRPGCRQREGGKRERITTSSTYGDNLDILRRYIPDASVDLVYLDPPFNANATYDVIFKSEPGRPSTHRLRADETELFGS